MYPLHQIGSTYSSIVRHAQTGEEVVALFVHGAHRNPPPQEELWCLFIDYRRSPTQSAEVPIFFGNRDQVEALFVLFHDKVLPWHASFVVPLPRRRGRPPQAQLLPALVGSAVYATELIAQVNATFPLWAMHVQGVWHQRLAEILGAVPVKRKTVVAKFAGMFRQPIPARLSRGFRPISVKR